MMMTKKEITEKVQKAFADAKGDVNLHAVPQIEKIVVNVGVGRLMTKDKKLGESVDEVLAMITGQRPLSTKAKKSISNFKLREGMTVGKKVTLRGARMYDFWNKLVNVVTPRIRDFQGFSEKLVDQHGNLNVGLKENLMFPETEHISVDESFGMQITIVINAGSHDDGVLFFKTLGFPFKK
jgi:large subunit ribosomal protein L5